MQFFQRELKLIYTTKNFFIL